MSDELLLSPGSDDGDWTDVVQRASRAHHRNQIYLGVVLVALLVAAAACAHAMGVVPWSSKKARPLPAHPALAPPCKASELSGDYRFQGAGFGSVLGPLELTNIGRHACSIVGRPKLWLVLSGGRRERASVSYSGRTIPPYPPIPLGTLRALPPGWRVSMMVQWFTNWYCVHGLIGIGVGLPHGGSVVVPVHGTPPCEGGSSSSSTFRVGPLNPERPLTSSRPLPLTARIVGRRNAVVGRRMRAFSARRGSVFHFRVALTNTGDRPFRFRSCPLYVEQGPATEKPPGLTQYTYVLNCRGVKFAPKATVLFQMQMPIPGDTRLGGGRLLWELAPNSSRVEGSGNERMYVSNSIDASAVLKIVR